MSEVTGPKGPRQTGGDINGSGLHNMKAFESPMVENKPSSSSQPSYSPFTTDQYERLDMDQLLDNYASAERAKAKIQLQSASLDRVVTRLVGVHDVDVDKVDDQILAAMGKVLETSVRQGVLLRKCVDWGQVSHDQFGNLADVVANMKVGTPRVVVNTFIDNMAVHLPKKPTDTDQGSKTGGSKPAREMSMHELMAKYNIPGHRMLVATGPEALARVYNPAQLPDVGSPAVNGGTGVFGGLNPFPVMIIPSALSFA